MENKSMEGFRVQMFDTMIESPELHEIKAAVDKDYRYLAGFSVSDVFCSDTAILESVRIKGKDILPEGMEAIHLKATKNVAPNKRFFALFVPVEISGEDLTIRFFDPGFKEKYQLQVHVLLANDPKTLYDVLYR